MANNRSAQPCGCDEGANWLCERHRSTQEQMIQSERGITAETVDTSTSTAHALTTAEWRKRRPLFSGVLSYFPDALLEVAFCSWKGNEQHNPGQPLHWAKEKSTDEHDALMRHLAEAGKIDSDGVRHSAKVAWRALAALQRELDKEKENR